MTTDPWSLSRTAASNTTIGGVSAAEGILPANLNNIDRALGAGLAELVYVLCGAITSAGTADAQTVTTSLSWASYAAGKMVSFKAGSTLTNTGACTLNVDGLGAKSVKDNAGNDPSAGAITAGGIYLCAYEATADAFLLLNPYSSVGAYLSNVVEDLTPQLGGDLDLNGHVITGLVIGTNVQAYDADLAALAANSSAGIIARTGAGTVAARTITGTSGKISVTDGDGVSGNPTITVGSDIKQVGKETIWIPAGAMKARTTNGAATGTAEMSTNKNMFVTLDFDTTTQEFAQFEIHFPKSWNLGTVTFQPVWSHASTTTNFGVVWGLAGVARSDDDVGDVAFGTAQTSTDTGGTTNDIYIGPESSAITIAGTPAAGDTVQFQLNRTVSDGSDTMAIDARLHGIRLFYTTSAANDT